MGDDFVYLSKEQINHLENITMYRLLYLFELVSFLQNWNQDNEGYDLGQVLRALPLVTEEHYNYISDHTILPDDVLDRFVDS